MSERRINPDTWVFEENTGFIFDNWSPVRNEDNNEERVNPDTGVLEENTGFIFDNWTPKR